MKLNLFGRRKEKYTCSVCGLVHDNWPALAFSSPSNHLELTEEEKKLTATLNEDFCTISYDDQIDRFIRVGMTQKVNDGKEDLEYGLWVSLSEPSFNDYADNFKNDNHEAEYFGWLCSRIPEYENTLNIPTTVVTQSGKDRPRIYPHKDFDHQLVIDFYNGIHCHEAQKRVDDMIRNVG